MRIFRRMSSAAGTHCWRAKVADRPDAPRLADVASDLGSEGAGAGRWSASSISDEVEDLVRGQIDLWFEEGGELVVVITRPMMCARGKCGSRGITRPSSGCMMAVEGLWPPADRAYFIFAADRGKWI
jgi:hypothetical protein